MAKHRSDILFILIFSCLVGIFFFQTIVKGKYPIPADSLVGLYHPWRDLYSEQYPRGIPFKNFLITDPVRQQIPWRKAIIDGWKQGTLPTWNPYDFSGVPLIANIQAAAFYPLNILFLVFDFLTGWTILIIIQPLLMGLFMYLYLQNRQIEYQSAFLSAIAWAFSGFTIAWLTWGTIIHVILWLPLILLSIDKLLQKNTVTWFFVLTFALSVQFFAGHAQISLYVFLLSFFYVIWSLYIHNAWKKKLILFILVYIGTVVTTAIQWIPFFKFYLDSSRSAGTDWTLEGWFLPWRHLVQFIFPDFFGNPTTLNYWGIWNYGEFIGYIGLVPLIFASYAFVFLKDNFAKFWKIIILITFILILPSTVSKLPYLLQIPFFSTLQPTRLISIIDISLVILSSIGFSFWIKSKDKKRIWFILSVFVMFFVLLWLFTAFKNNSLIDSTLQNNLSVAKRNMIFPTGILFGVLILFLFDYVSKNLFLKRIIVTFGLLTLTALDLFRFGWKFIPFTPKEYFFPQTKITQFLKKQDKPFRVMSVDKRILPPNSAGFYGLETIEGYDPLIDMRYEEFMTAIARGTPDISFPSGFNRIITLENVSSPFLSLMNVRYVLSLTTIKNLNLTKVFEEGETKVYELTTYLPRAFSVSSLTWTKSKEQVLQRFFESTFNAKEEALVEISDDITPISQQVVKGEVKVMNYSTNRLVLETNFPNDFGFVVISNKYSPFWKATVFDEFGKFIHRTKIYRTDYLFMGIFVTSGKHIVEFRANLL